MIENKKYKLIITVMGIVIIALSILCILFATDVITFKKKSNPVKEKDYSNYIGVWHDVEKYFEGDNAVAIYKITDNEIELSWSLYRLTGTDKVTLPLRENKAEFCYQGQFDMDMNGELDEDEDYMRKANIYLGDKGVDIIVEDVTSFDESCTLLEFGGSGYIGEGEYNYIYKEK